MSKFEKQAASKIENLTSKFMAKEKELSSDHEKAQRLLSLESINNEKQKKIELHIDLIEYVLNNPQSTPDQDQTELKKILPPQQEANELEYYQNKLSIFRKQTAEQLKESHRTLKDLITAVRPSAPEGAPEQLSPETQEKVEQAQKSWWQKILSGVATAGAAVYNGVKKAITATYEFFKTKRGRRVLIAGLVIIGLAAAIGGFLYLLHGGIIPAGGGEIAQEGLKQGGKVIKDIVGPIDLPKEIITGAGKHGTF